MIQPDVIGLIPDQLATFGEQGNQITETTWLPGWHVNTLEPVPEWSDYLCDPQPASPYRVYAGGIMPVCYVFPDEDTYLAVLPDMFKVQEDTLA